MDAISKFYCKNIDRLFLTCQTNNRNCAWAFANIYAYNLSSLNIVYKNPCLVSYLIYVPIPYSVGAILSFNRGHIIRSINVSWQIFRNKHTHTHIRNTFEGIGVGVQRVFTVMGSRRADMRNTDNTISPKLVRYVWKQRRWNPPQLNPLSIYDFLICTYIHSNICVRFDVICLLVRTFYNVIWIQVCVVFVYKHTYLNVGF